MTQLLGASRPIDQRMACRLVRWPPIHREQKESPGRAGVRNIKECLMLTRRPNTTQGTNHARRGMASGVRRPPGLTLSVVPPR